MREEATWLSTRLPYPYYNQALKQDATTCPSPPEGVQLRQEIAQLKSMVYDLEYRLGTWTGRCRRVATTCGVSWGPPIFIDGLSVITAGWRPLSPSSLFDGQPKPTWLLAGLRHYSPPPQFSSTWTEDSSLWWRQMPLTLEFGPCYHSVRRPTRSYTPAPSALVIFPQTRGILMSATGSC